MLQAVGYYGPAAAAPAAFARLSAGLDEAIVRVVAARPGLEPVIAAMAALTPALIRAAAAVAPNQASIRGIRPTRRGSSSNSANRRAAGGLRHRAVRPAAGPAVHGS